MPQHATKTSFKKGQSGNPAGKAVGTKDYKTLYQEALLKLAKLNNLDPEQLEVEIVSNALLSARKGDYRFYKDVMDRIHGTAVEKHEIIQDFDYE